MKKALCYFFTVASLVVFHARAAAQHYIALQAADNAGFSVNLNGTNFLSSKTGLLRISNLLPGSYMLLINFPGNKFPQQTFNCIVGAGDESYTLKNLGQAGWVLKSLKDNKVVTPINNGWDDVPEGRATPNNNAFGQMLAQVADDTDLLKPTVWVYTAKPDTAGDDPAPVAQAQEDTTAAYATKGVIKVSEEDVNAGKALVFYAFDAKGGDTVHVIVPSAKTAVNSPADTLLLVKNDSAAKAGNTPANVTPPAVTGSDSTLANKQAVAQINAARPGANDDTLLFGRPHKTLTDTTTALDTAAGKPFTNPFFNKTAPAAVEPGQADSINKQPPVLSGDTSATLVKTGAAEEGSTVNTKPAAGDSAAPKLLVRESCGKPLTANAYEKLKHKIYLETDERKMVDIATKNISGKCVTIEQVKGLANFFLSDDSRLNFFKAVYPFVYDYGNFTTLESYMIDKSYKEMFRAFFK